MPALQKSNKTNEQMASKRKQESCLWIERSNITKDSRSHKSQSVLLLGFCRKNELMTFSASITKETINQAKTANITKETINQAKTVTQISLMQSPGDIFTWVYGDEPVVTLHVTRSFCCVTERTICLGRYLLVGVYEMYESEKWDEEKLDSFISDLQTQFEILDASRSSLHDLWSSVKGAIQ
jgi:hypothetical protein